ncbi:MAG: helix-turn-helix domain-containing protein [Clostridiales bacterium]|nr:helix-turn-helix domain-containing protein [Clostridiales bacterium]
MFRLKEIRMECGIKRSKLATDLNMNAGTIANYENEIRQAPYECLILFANYFDVSVDYLLGRAENETPVKAERSLSAEEAALLKKYQALGKLGKSRVLEYMELWEDKQ